MDFATSESYAAAYTCRDDMPAPKQLQTVEPIQATQTAACSTIDVSTNTAGCDSSMTDAEAQYPVGGVRNELNIQHPPDPTRDPNPIYKPNTVNPTNVRNPNPTYPQNAPTAGPNVCLEPAAFDNPQYSSTQGDGSPASVTANHDGNAFIEQHATNNGCHFCTQANAARSLGPVDSDDCCQPYAVRYQDVDDDDDNTAIDETAASNREALDIAPEACDDDIQPYAVAHMSQEDTGHVSSEETRTKTRTSRIYHETTNVAACPSSQNDGDPTVFARHVHHTLHTNSMYGQNNLNPNPMYVPNAHQEATCGSFPRCSRVSAAVIASAILATFILFGTFAGLYFNTAAEDGRKGTTTTGPFQTSLPTWTSASKRSTESYDRDSHLERITFGGKGSDPGKFIDPSGVAVSKADEIFVTDSVLQRVQVYSMKGAHLRLFPTVVPGENGHLMYPCGIAIDGEGHVWVVGRYWTMSSPVYAVQYSPDGEPLSKINVQRLDWFPFIAIDMQSDEIVVKAANEILKFQPNGSFDGSFGKEDNLYMDYIASDNGGNILVSTKDLVSTLSFVRVYNYSGHCLFEFGTAGPGEGILIEPKGICMDRFGRIIVANKGSHRVDMFTSRGEFVRTVANITEPWGVAVGSGGQLVVTRVNDNAVTIFPSKTVFL
ncbi:PREDICTED: uncharacterized protein LOC109474129 [Branchiostoma belcheri]|uniref:Uncharacterized protein LOC109474129 n=1 Tax=Branchiostoma belcheri TaxID=7741 RepID=A0A6P4ZJT9_BRABE|nr:PREDICTED: uncharacterized protein LOC109474129 [Branchiostoma belcheri]